MNLKFTDNNLILESDNYRIYTLLKGITIKEEDDISLEFSIDDELKMYDLKQINEILFFKEYMIIILNNRNRRIFDYKDLERIELNYY